MLDSNFEVGLILGPFGRPHDNLPPVMLNLSLLFCAHFLMLMNPILEKRGVTVWIHLL